MKDIEIGSVWQQTSDQFVVIVSVSEHGHVRWRNCDAEGKPLDDEVHRGTNEEDFRFYFRPAGE